MKLLCDHRHYSHFCFGLHVIHARVCVCVRECVLRYILHMHEEKILRQNLFGDLGLTDLANKLASEPYGSSSPVFIPAALDIDI